MYYNKNVDIKKKTIETLYSVHYVNNFNCIVVLHRYENVHRLVNVYI